MEMISAVVDRIVDGEHVVLLVGPEEEEVVVPRAALPAKIREGTWLQVCFVDGQLKKAVIDEKATQEAVQRIASKMDLLRQRGRNPN